MGDASETKQSSEVADGVGLLMRFHAQVRAHMARLRELRDAVASRELASVQEAMIEAAEVVRFLELRTPLHERDEVESLFPRLAFALRRAGETQTEVAAEIARAEDDHVHFETVWRPLQHWLWQLSTPDGIVSLERFGRAVDAIEEHFEHHFAREEGVIFEAARRLLDPGELAEMATEMRSRHTC